MTREAEEKIRAEERVRARERALIEQEVFDETTQTRQHRKLRFWPALLGALAGALTGGLLTYMFRFTAASGLFPAGIILGALIGFIAVFAVYH